MLTSRVGMSILVSATLHAQEASPETARGLGPDGLVSQSLIVVSWESSYNGFRPRGRGQNSHFQAFLVGEAGMEIRRGAR